MKPRSLLILLSILFFSGGNIINLFFSSNLLWGEMEATLLIQQTGMRRLKLDCPLVVAPWENAIIKTIITNDAPIHTTPQVNAFISSASDGMRVESQTLNLESSESIPLTWTLNSADMVFERLILVNIFQRPYRTLKSRQGTCSIYVYSLFGMNGRATMLTITEVGVILSVVGIGLMHYLLHPLADKTKKLMSVNILFLILVLLGLFSAIQRLWGFTLFFNASALLAIFVAYIEILFSSEKRPSV